MAIFNGRYRWDGTKRNNRDPIAWSPGAYDVKIFRCASSSSKVEHLKSIVCVYAATGEGQSISANPEKFAKQICNDFQLDMERVLWVEDTLKDQDRYEVVMFARSGKIGNIVFYRSQKRVAFKSEVEMIGQVLSAVEASVE